MRKTSIETYRAIKENGLLSRRRLEAYEILMKSGPMTARELDREGGTTGLWKRLSELRDMGVVEEVGERPCRVGHGMAITWDVTDRLPKNKKKTERQKCLFCKGTGYEEMST